MLDDSSGLGLHNLNVTHDCSKSSGLRMCIVQRRPRLNLAAWNSACPPPLLQRTVMRTPRNRPTIVKTVGSAPSAELLSGPQMKTEAARVLQLCPVHCGRRIGCLAAQTTLSPMLRRQIFPPRHPGEGVFIHNHSQQVVSGFECSSVVLHAALGSNTFWRRNMNAPLRRYPVSPMLRPRTPCPQTSPLDSERRTPTCTFPCNPTCTQLRA
ncbi:hypothetical protein CYLTODRAFT_277614 [Cylindrobasidium torrendii FP15055 ss-10]|uniref:Uncharacterized protein n=1 Tax=Cylindrobasidium torrendii FP15055 ss-10 TaxID=1314674 RepID=A0A0D7BCJ2_9AGAR|nr:hypothetical protein CYLTODRAFT_277614 [Cylindrobasidium torrendii FP15055 ss-10]